MSLLGRLFGGGKAKKAADAPNTAMKGGEGAKAKAGKSSKPKAKAARASGPAKKGPAGKTRSKK